MEERGAIRGRSCCKTAFFACRSTPPAWRALTVRPHARPLAGPLLPLLHLLQSQLCRVTHCRMPTARTDPDCTATSPPCCSPRSALAAADMHPTRPALPAPPPTTASTSRQQPRGRPLPVPPLPRSAQSATRQAGWRRSPGGAACAQSRRPPRRPRSAARLHWQAGRRANELDGRPSGSDTRDLTATVAPSQLSVSVHPPPPPRPLRHPHL